MNSAPDSYGSPVAPAADAYSSPIAPSIAAAPEVDSYGAPQAASDSYSSPLAAVEAVPATYDAPQPDLNSIDSYD